MSKKRPPLEQTEDVQQVLRPIGKHLHPHAMLPPTLRDHQLEDLFNTTLAQHLEAICAVVASELEVSPQQLLSAMRSHCGERAARIITLRSQFGFQNASSCNGNNMAITIPINISKKAKRLLECDETLHHHIAWTQNVHSATVTCNHGSFKLCSDNPHWIDFFIYKQRSKIQFRLLHTLVCTIAMQHDADPSELRWVNPIYQPDGQLRSYEQLRTIAKICDIDTRQIQDLICMRKAMPRNTIDFRRGDLDEISFKTSPHSESQMINP